MNRLRFLACLLAAVPLIAAAQTPAPGEYLTERGWGTLVVTKKADGGAAFSIEATGANGHSCSLDGEIAKGKATLATGVDDKPCVVQFEARKNAINVQPNAECRHFCGMRASFDGIYSTPEKGCSSAEVAGARDKFKPLYDRKEYPAARAVLEPVLAGCVRTLHPWTLHWIRNDLALSQYRSGDAAACLKTLAPLAKDAGNIGKALENYPPTDADTYGEILRATRTNLRLCRRAPVNRNLQ